MVCKPSLSEVKEIAFSLFMDHILAAQHEGVRKFDARQEIRMKKSFYIKAIWDDEAKVFYSESDIDGLHIETKTLEEFEDVMMDLASDLVMANHRTVREMASIPLRDLIPAILWQKPDRQAVA